MTSATKAASVADRKPYLRAAPFSMGTVKHKRRGDMQAQSRSHNVRAEWLKLSPWKVFSQAPLERDRGEVRQ